MNDPAGQYNFILFDDNTWDNLLPLTFTRPVSEIRAGLLTLREKWEKYLPFPCSCLTKEYLSDKFKQVVRSDNILINSSVIPGKQLVDSILNLKNNQILLKDYTLIAIRLSEEQIKDFDIIDLDHYEVIFFESAILRIQYPWNIFQFNGELLISDILLIKQNRKSQPLSPTVNIIGRREDIFVEPGASLEYVTLNSTTGPIYIGKEAVVMEGSAIRGPFALCEHSEVKMGSKIYGPTTIGPYSKVAGEINNCVIFGYSNKAHDGFLGNSVLGEWCNIGADSNCSNLKNNYGDISVWNYPRETFIKTGLQFCGLIMGDHSKCGINTMFNTGTVLGVFVNLFGAGFPRNFIPSFSWGGPQGFQTYELKKAFEVAQRVMERRNIIFDDTEKKILTYLFENRNMKD